MKGEARRREEAILRPEGWVPFAPLLTLSFCSRISGSSLEDLLSNRDRTSRIVSRIYDSIGSDWYHVDFPLLSLTRSEAERIEARRRSLLIELDCGSSIAISEEGSSTCIEPAREPESIRDLLSEERLRVLEELGDLGYTAGRALGPISFLLAFILGERLFLMMAESSRELEDYLREAGRFLVDFCRMQAERGARAIVMNEPMLDPKMIGERRFLELCDILLNLLSRLRNLDIVLHVCSPESSLERMLDLARRTGIICLSLEDAIDISKLRGSSFTLMGNISIDLLAEGSPRDVLEESKRLLNLMRGERFILSSSCYVRSDTKIENLRAMEKARRGS